MDIDIFQQNIMRVVQLFNLGIIISANDGIELRCFVENLEMQIHQHRIEVVLHLFSVYAVIWEQQLLKAVSSMYFNLRIFRTKS